MTGTLFIYLASMFTRDQFLVREAGGGGISVKTGINWLLTINSQQSATSDPESLPWVSRQAANTHAKNEFSKFDTRRPFTRQRFENDVRSQNASFVSAPPEYWKAIRRAIRREGDTFHTDARIFF